MEQTTLKQLLEKGPVLAPCVYDCLSARITERAGFQAMCLSGGELAASYCGLKEKRIEAAALDTLERTVIEGENPLRTLRNVILTPGIGRFTREELVRTGCEAARIAAELLSESDGSVTK